MTLYQLCEQVYWFFYLSPWSSVAQAVAALSDCTDSSVSLQHMLVSSVAVGVLQQPPDSRGFPLTLPVSSSYKTMK